MSSDPVIMEPGHSAVPPKKWRASPKKKVPAPATKTPKRCWGVYPKKKVPSEPAVAPAPNPKHRPPILRFCREGTACPNKDTGCRYVHGDTIPKIDKPCEFEEKCGAPDPTGLKRSQCRYMHPGEEWSADLCIRHPAATP